MTLAAFWKRYRPQSMEQTIEHVYVWRARLRMNYKDIEYDTNDLPKPLQLCTYVKTMQPHRIIRLLRWEPFQMHGNLHLCLDCKLYWQDFTSRTL